MALVCGDHEVNEVKLKALLRVKALKMAEQADVEAIGSVPGYIGPVGMADIVVVGARQYCYENG